VTGCPVCGGPPPCYHDLGVILNGAYYCPDRQRHEWNRPTRWFKRVCCMRCGYRRKER